MKIMPNSTILPQGLENESDDAPKKFKNIDTEDFVSTWGGRERIVKAGETVTEPKYLVNYMAMHLARKMYKRKMFEGKSEAEKSIGIVRTVNPEEEYKLQIQMVADNFETLPEAPEFPKAPELKPEPTPEPEPKPDLPITPEKKEEGKPEDVSKKCEICGFVAKNKVGLLAHKRFKHK